MPTSVLQSKTTNNDDTSYGAHLAIDGDLTTQSSAEKDDNQKVWFQVSFDQVYCIKQVVNKTDVLFKFNAFDWFYKYKSLGNVKSGKS